MPKRLFLRIPEEGADMKRKKERPKPIGEKLLTLQEAAGILRLHPGPVGVAFNPNDRFNYKSKDCVLAGSFGALPPARLPFVASLKFRQRGKQCIVNFVKRQIANDSFIKTPQPVFQSAAVAMRQWGKSREYISCTVKTTSNRMTPLIHSSANIAERASLMHRTV